MALHADAQEPHLAQDSPPLTSLFRDGVDYADLNPDWETIREKSKAMPHAFGFAVERCGGLRMIHARSCAWDVWIV